MFDRKFDWRRIDAVEPGVLESRSKRIPRSGSTELAEVLLRG